MKYFEIATGYTSIPAKIGAATEKDVEGQTKSMVKMGYDVCIVDIKDSSRLQTDLPIIEVYMPKFFNSNKVVQLGFVHKIKRVLYSISFTLTIFLFNITFSAFPFLNFITLSAIGAIALL